MRAKSDLHGYQNAAVTYLYENDHALALAPVGCVAPETLVLTEAGPTPIWRIDRPTRVVSWNETTSQFQLSWCGGAFPKGTGYLYRVTTPRGEFVAAGRHQIYVGDGKYEFVSSLVAGHSAPAYSPDPAPTSAAPVPQSWPADVPHSTRRRVGFLGRYAASARRHGLRFLREEAVDLAFVPPQDDAQVRMRHGGYAVEIAMQHTLRAPLPVRSRHGLRDGRTRTDGSRPPAGRLHAAAASQGVALLLERLGGLAQLRALSPPTTSRRQTAPQPALPCSQEALSCCTLSERRIVSVQLEEVKRSYWDMQVLDTNNYVTMDGTIHHNSGKTAIGWTAATELMDAGIVRHPLVFAPLRVAQLVWPQERNDWEHLVDRPVVAWGGEPAGWADSPWKASRVLWGSWQHAEARAYRGGAHAQKADDLGRQWKASRAAMAELTPAPAVHVTSYENLMWLCDLYEPGTSPFDLWIFDEIGKLKNPKSPRYKAVKKQTKHAKIVWGMNATPAPEGFEDLFSQVDIVDGGKLWGRSFYKWQRQHFYPTDYQGYNWELIPTHKKIIIADLNTLAFRIDEKDLAYQRSTTHTHIEVSLPDKAMFEYDRMFKDMLVELKIDPKTKADDVSYDQIVAMSKAASSMKLRQITQGFIYNETGEAHVLHTAKIDALSDLIDSMGREPLLVAYQFIEDLEAIRKIWKNVPYLGQGVSAAQAQENVEKWNRREIPVMAVHPNSAGHGLNLQHGGSHICWYALPWSLEGFEQTGGRIDRQGQTRACYAHHIVAADTIDRRVSAALEFKAAAQDAIIEGIRKI